MTTPTLREASQALVDILRELHYGRMPERVQTAFDAVQSALAAQPELPEPVAAQSKFIDANEWGWCSIEHHYLVLANPNEWPNYETRLLYTAARASAQAVPDGWQLVPVEPTESMYQRVMREGYYHDPVAARAVLRAEYRDMLEAAPQHAENKSNNLSDID